MGQTTSLELEYTTDEEWVEEEIYAFAIIHPAGSKLILQSASSLDSPTGIGNQSMDYIRAVLYPNPADVYVSVSPEYITRFQRAELFTLTGNRVKIFRQFERMDISQQPPGLNLWY